MTGPTSAATGPTARILVLGPLDLRLGSASLGLGAPRQRALLALLALAGGRVCSVPSIIDQLWGDDPPATVVNAVQVYVASLRKTLAPAGLDSCLVTQAPGYRLILPEGALDLESFDAARRKGSAASAGGDHEGAAAAYLTALELWRGPVLADLGSAPFAATERTRLEEERVAALLGWLRALLALGEHEAALPHLETALAAQPLNETLWAMRATALYRGGRQSDALAALRRARRLLSHELGIDPGPGLLEVERQILAQDPGLAPPPTRRAAGSAVTHPATAGTSGAALVLPDGRRVAIGRQEAVVVGRHAGCEVVLDHRDVSRRHAVIRAVARGHEVEDLRSTNGTAVNGDLLVGGPRGRRALAHGDRVELGPLILRYEAGSPA